MFGAVATFIILGIFTLVTIADDEIDRIKANNPEPMVPVTLEDARREVLKSFDSYDVIKIDAEEWICKYVDDLWGGKVQAKMKAQWKEGHFIQLTGKIHKIRYDFIDGCCITIQQQRRDSINDGWVFFDLRVFDEDQIQKALKFKPGEKITTIGYSGWDIGPKLINCIFR